MTNDDVKQVWKYSLDLGANFIELPQRAKVVHVGLQGGAVTMWVSVLTRWMGEDFNPNESAETRTFTVHGTGHDIPYKSDYLGTVQNAPYVWHVYETFAK